MLVLDADNVKAIYRRAMALEAKGDYDQVTKLVCQSVSQSGRKEGSRKSSPRDVSHATRSYDVGSHHPDAYYTYYTCSLTPTRPRSA